MKHKRFTLGELQELKKIVRMPNCKEKSIIIDNLCQRLGRPRSSILAKAHSLKMAEKNSHKTDVVGFTDTKDKMFDLKLKIQSISLSNGEIHLKLKY